MTSAEYNHSAFCFYLIEKICHPFGIWNVDLAILESFHPFGIVAGERSEFNINPVSNL
jgi:hypothetical protein